METTMLAAFGTLLKQYRVAAGLSQEALAERAKLSTRGVQDIERGVNRTPHLHTVELLADALQLTAGERIALEAGVNRRRGPSRSSSVVIDTRLHNLPAPLTTFVGREEEIDQARALLRRPMTRLVTITGPGGVGKSRLALEVATGLLDIFADGIFVVSLAPLRDAALVPSAIAQALALKATNDRSFTAALTEYLRERELLLLLDNFEQVVEASSVVVELLAACARLKVLVTSRAVLGVQGEYSVQVQPLAVPDPRGRAGVERLLGFDAVQLFLERAQSVQASFRLTETNARSIAAICQRTDGLPLAIELAAARLNVLTADALATRLRNPLALLRGGGRDRPDRHRTLREAIGWSYGLLDASEMALFRRLSVFSGGCTIEAAEAVCSVPTALGMPVLDGLASLVDKSLLQQQDSMLGEAWFVLLETVREYGREFLEAKGEEEALRARHAAYYLTLVETTAPELGGAQEQVWLEWLEREHDNLRAALSWAQTQGEVEFGLRLAGALWRFWYVQGHLAEGSRWLMTLLALDGRIGHPATPMVRALALNGAGTLALQQGDHDRAAAYQEEYLALQRASGDSRGRAAALHTLAMVVEDRGD